MQQNDPVMEFMDATNSNIDVEIDCPYDSTAVFEKESKHYTHIQLLLLFYGATVICFFLFFR